MPDKEATALRLEEARRQLEDQLRQAFRSHDGPGKGSVQFDINLEEAETSDDGNGSLGRLVRSLVDAFHQSDIARQTGVRVYKVTAIDSNADGESAVNVKYEYAADTGMGADNIGATTAAHLPPSSAG